MMNMKLFYLALLPLLSPKEHIEVPGKSLISKNNIHSLSKYLRKSRSLSKDVLNFQVLVGDVAFLLVSERETGTWSLIVIG